MRSYLSRGLIPKNRNHFCHIPQNERKLDIGIWNKYNLTLNDIIKGSEFMNSENLDVTYTQLLHRLKS